MSDRESTLASFSWGIQLWIDCCRAGAASTLGACAVLERLMQDDGLKHGERPKHVADVVPLQSRGTAEIIPFPGRRARR
jgi:hypothetical protein